ncbi:MAG: SLC26A/SulP transporter family protein [Rhodospirillaceae bacterium]|nr:SLC26A/SulP transporter family protein [Rhodospirillales bacterium]
MFMQRFFPTLVEPGMGSNLRRDVSGAVAATLISVPQTMAYGVIAVSLCGPDWTGAGVLAGLYGSVLAGILAVMLGSNPIIIVGPRAATVLVLAALLGHLIQLPGVDVVTALAYAGATVVMAGVFQVALGFLRLGLLAEFIPYPVIAGFLNGSALLIITSQWAPLTGLPKAASVGQFMGNLSGIAPGPLCLGLFTAVVIFKAPKFIKGVPPSLAGLVVGTAAYYLAGMLGFAGGLGGTVPPLPESAAIGLTDLASLGAAFGTLDAELLGIILPAALSMAALSSLDAALTSVTLDQIMMRRSDSNREIVAQGFANVLAGGLGLLPSSGSMARTGALCRAGARTALAPILTALFVLVVTLGLAPFVRLLPQAVVAGLLLVVGIDLFDKWSLGILRRLHWRSPSRQPLSDLLAIVVVVAATLIFNLVTAVGVGTLVSLTFFVLRMARSPIRRFYCASALVARMQGDFKRLAFMERHGDAIAVIELEGTLFFGSTAALLRKVDELMESGIRHFVLDMKRVKDLDATAARTLERLQAQAVKRGGCLAMAYVEPERRRRNREDLFFEDRRHHLGERRLWRALEQAGSLAVLDCTKLQPDLDGAVLLCERHLAASLAADGSLAELEQSSPAILNQLDKAALRRLRPYMTRCSLAAGQVIFKQGDPPDSIYFLASGGVEVSINLPRTDRKMRVQTLSEGAVFGEMAVIDPKPRSANITTLQESVCYRLSADDFERLKVEQPDLAFRLLENVALIFAERLRASNVMMAELEV